MYRANTVGSTQASSPPPASSSGMQPTFVNGGMQSGVNGPTFVLLNNGIGSGGVIPTAGVQYQPFVPGMAAGKLIKYREGCKYCECMFFEADLVTQSERAKGFKASQSCC